MLPHHKFPQGERRRLRSARRQTRLAPARKALTLIELLVVVAIVVILASLLFPMAKKMIEKGQAAACMSNLRNLWTGATLYAGDHNGFLPWFENRNPKETWDEAIAPYVGVEQILFSRYRKNWEKKDCRPVPPFTCPSTANNWWIGYGWNYQGLGHSPVPAIATKPPREYTRDGPTHVGSKPDVVMLADSWYASDPTPGDTAPPSHNALATATGGHPAPSPHDGGLNALFVDGHIEWHRSETFYDEVKITEGQVLD